MKALILAAGFGSRLAPLTDLRPKSLVPVNGKPIIFKQIENLHASGVTDVTVVSGYKADVLESAVRTEFPEVRFVRNLDYAVTNNMYSAYLARESLRGDAFLMMNADVFFDPSITEALVVHEAPSSIVVDVGNYLEESMKVTERDGRVTAISKAIPCGEAFGVSIDVYKFSPSSGRAFFAKCEEYIDRKGERNLWSEVALNDVLARERFEPCPSNGKWVEIDNHEDLALAEKLFRE